MANKPIRNRTIFFIVCHCPQLVTGGRSFLILYCFMLFSVGGARPQSPVNREAANNSSITALNIGDNIPDALWNTPLQVVNHPQGKQTVTLADYKGKLIILDFWATWCSSCIKNFPKLKKLQDENNLDLQVILVNSKANKDKTENVERFLKQKDYEFQSLVNDTILKALFPHNSIPHYVWIKEQRFIALSNAQDLTKINVMSALERSQIETTFATELPYNTRLPLFENGNGGEAPKYLFKSILTPFVNGLKSTISTNKDNYGRISRISITNGRIFSLYLYAYPKLADLTTARFVLDVKDKEPFSSDSTSFNWNTKHLYNYEAQFPKTSLKNAQLFVQQDLQKFFRYKIDSTSKEMECWVVKSLNPERVINFQKDVPSETNLYNNEGSDIFFKNYPLAILLAELERQYNVPFIDETGIDTPVKLKLPRDLLNVLELQAILKSQGLLLVKEKRIIPVITLSDNQD